MLDSGTFPFFLFLETNNFSDEEARAWSEAEQLAKSLKAGVCLELLRAMINHNIMSRLQREAPRLAVVPQEPITKEERIAKARHEAELTLAAIYNQAPPAPVASIQSFLEN